MPDVDTTWNATGEPSGHGQEHGQEQGQEQGPPPGGVGGGAPSASTSTGTSSTSSSTPQAPSQQQPKEDESYKGDMTAYCKSLESWLWKAYWQRVCANSAYFTALSSIYPSYLGFQTAGATISGASNSTTSRLHIRFRTAPANVNNNNAAAPNLNIQQNPQYVRQILITRTNGPRAIVGATLAPLWKRLLAEAIDFMILLVIKIFVTLTIIDNFDIIDFNNVDFSAFEESGSMYEVAVALSWEIILLELAHRIIVCFFEAICLCRGGCTPGKSILGLRVLYCEHVFIVNSRIIVTPGTFLSFHRAFFRSVLKNLSLAFFFPLYFTLFSFEHSRTLYDVFAKSIVMEVQQH